MIADSYPQRKPSPFTPTDDFTKGRWQQVSLPRTYYKAMSEAHDWQACGFEVLVTELQDGWRVYILVEARR